MAVSINILNRKWNHSLIEEPFTFETLLTLLWYVKVSQFICFFGDSWNLKNVNIFKFHESQSQQKQHMVYKLRPLRAWNYEYSSRNNFNPFGLMCANELVMMRTKIDYIAYGIQEIATQQNIQK